MINEITDELVSLAQSKEFVLYKIRKVSNINKVISLCDFNFDYNLIDFYIVNKYNIVGSGKTKDSKNFLLNYNYYYNDSVDEFNGIYNIIYDIKNKYFSWFLWDDLKNYIKTEFVNKYNISDYSIVSYVDDRDPETQFYVFNNIYKDNIINKLKSEASTYYVNIYLLNNDKWDKI